MASSWSLVALACVALAALSSNANNAQLTSGSISTLETNESATSNLKKEILISGGSQAPTTGGDAARVGLAPHERPACRLPAGGQRRWAASVAATAQQQQQQQPNQTPILDNLVTNNSFEKQTKLQSLALVEPVPLVASSPQQSSRAELASRRPQRTQVDSSERLRQLRQLLISNNYDAYLVGPNDEHGSEYVTEFDRRLRFISGFSGSMGYALVLLDRAVLFTDGRYELQADADLDCNWWLVVGQEPAGADIVGWLRAQNASSLRVATDARLMPLATFDYLDEQLRTRLDSELALISQDLVDLVWDSHQASVSSSGSVEVRPRARSHEPLQVHALQFAGQLSWQHKVLKLAELMWQRHKARHYVVAKLDDIAWLLNLRGADIPMSPLFKAYLFVSRSAPGEKTSAQKQLSSVEQLLNAIELQKLQQQQATKVTQLIKLTLYVDLKKLTAAVRDHLNLLDLSNGTATNLSQQTIEGDQLVQLGASSARIQVELRDYDVFVLDFREKFAQKSATSAAPTALQGKLLLDAQANVAIHVLAKTHEDRLVLVEPLIQRLKAVKSASEVQGMRLAHWRDSLAIAMLLAQLERDLDSSSALRDINLTYGPFQRQQGGRQWTEASAAKELEFLRSLMDYNRGQSFDTISAYASNGAIVHYKPSADNDEQQQQQQRTLANESTYLLDSGGQYLDGTTDITRTLHFGQPSEWQRETYTRVLMGAIDMMSLVFAAGDQLGPGKRLNDLLARRHLLELGLDYAHGTGHGIGAYSLVHEAPALIEHFAATSAGCTAPRGAAMRGLAAPPAVHNEPLALQANMFTSVEPGYYEPGEFGIRLENIVVTQKWHASGAVNSNNNHSISESKLAKSLLRFEPISLVPFEPKLINFELLSNKQKAWLNSYNLMVRLRITQQINYYLARLRNQQNYQSKPLNGSAAVGSAQTQAPEASSFGPNFAKVEAASMQQLLELAHKWILSKTELIALDVPARFLHEPETTHPDSGAAQGEAHQRDSWASLGTDPDGQRLMLAYMAQLPFGDQEAAQASAALLSGRSESAPFAQQQDGVQSAQKCAGIECDLLLLEALNAHQQHTNSASGAQRGALAQANWKTTNSEHELLSQQVPVSTWNKWRQQLADLFQLSGADSSARTSWAASLLANMWPLLGIGALLVLALQLALMLYVCNGSSSAASSNQQPARSGRRAQQRQRDAHDAHWQTTSSGRRLAHIGSALASSFRLRGATEQEAANQAATAVV